MDEDKLKKTESENLWWRQILSQMPEIVMTVDKQGSILYINHTLPSFTPEQVVGTSVFNYIPTGYHEAYKETIAKVFQTGEMVSFEVTGVGPDGTTAWYDTKIAAIKGDSGQVEAVSTISVDITKRKLLEDEVTRLKSVPTNPGLG